MKPNTKYTMAEMTFLEFTQKQKINELLCNHISLSHMLLPFFFWNNLPKLMAETDFFVAGLYSEEIKLKEN